MVLNLLPSFSDYIQNVSMLISHKHWSFMWPKSANRSLNSHIFLLLISFLGIETFKAILLILVVSSCRVIHELSAFVIDKYDGNGVFLTDDSFDKKGWLKFILILHLCQLFLLRVLSVYYQDKKSTLHNIKQWLYSTWPLCTGLKTLPIS